MKQLVSAWGGAGGMGGHRPHGLAQSLMPALLCVQISSRVMAIPSGVEIEVKARRVRVKGPRGECNCWAWSNTWAGHAAAQGAQRTASGGGGVGGGGSRPRADGRQQQRARRQPAAG